MATIMVVDDASFMRAVLKKIILQSGHEIVAEAANGDDAINQYQSSKPDLVLMDIVMPPTLQPMSSCAAAWANKP
jgi:two-component system chemotaxis response regulator CheY